MGRARVLLSWRGRKLEKVEEDWGGVQHSRERIKWQNITQREAHWARERLEAPAFERERWLLRDQNILMSVSRGMNRDGTPEPGVESYGEEREDEWRKREGRREEENSSPTLKYIGKIPLPNLTREEDLDHRCAVTGRRNVDYALGHLYPISGNSCEKIRWLCRW